MATTTSFGWETPDDTDLVKDGAAAIRTLGNSIDTSMSELKGGTTGQVLSKTSNTDMDFTWVAQDDSNAIQNALLTTTGDTIYASSANTPARRAIGSSGQVLTVSGGVPTWATPSTGSYTQLATGSLSGSSVSITSISGSYKALVLQVYGFSFSATGELRFTLNSGTSAYGYTTLSNGTATGSGSSGVAYGSFGGTVQTYNDAPSAWLQIPFYAQSGVRLQWIGGIEGVNGSNGAPHQSMTFGGVNANGALTSIQLFPQSGTFSAGTYYLYGVN